MVFYRILPVGALRHRHAHAIDDISILYKFSQEFSANNFLNFLPAFLQGGEKTDSLFYFTGKLRLSFPRRGFSPR